MQRLVLDSARPQDVPALVALLGLLFSQEADFQPDPAKQTRALTTILAQPAAGCIFVARVAGRVVGMVNLLFLVSTAESGRVIQLEDVVVQPDFRGQGLGRRLLQQVIAFAREKKSAASPYSPMTRMQMPDVYACIMGSRLPP
jgi:predicted N-acetyltransferase YhbS